MSKPFTFFGGLRAFWREGLDRGGLLRTTRHLLSETWDFLRDSTPSRRRQRFGDIEFDLDHRVDTTSARLPLRTRLRGLVFSPYQPTDPALFHEILQRMNLNWPEFTFIDVGSGKGRTLLMASEYPFRRILGLEILPELHQVALENVRKYRDFQQRCFAIECVCADAREFVFPPEPSVINLFNPLAEAGLAKVIANVEASLRKSPRTLYVVYHNPEHEPLLTRSAVLKRIGGTQSYVVYGTEAIGNSQQPRWPNPQLTDNS